jgi:hypothetical protein
MSESETNRSRSPLLALTLCAGALVAACATPYSEVPLATNFETSKQLKLQAGSHWNAIARDTAQHLLAQTGAGKGCVSPMPLCDRVYVKEPKDNSAFARAFRTQFITTLVNGGANVAKTPAGAKEIDIDIRIDGHFTSATAIYAGLWGLHGIWIHTSPGAAGALALGAFDANRWMHSELASGPVPQHEVIVTVSASNADQYLGRVTNVYYVADTDRRLYPQSVQPSTIPVRGGE